MLSRAKTASGVRPGVECGLSPFGPLQAITHHAPKDLCQSWHTTLVRGNKGALQNDTVHCLVWRAKRKLTWPAASRSSLYNWTGPPTPLESRAGCFWEFLFEHIYRCKEVHFKEKAFLRVSRLSSQPGLLHHFFFACLLFYVIQIISFLLHQGQSSPYSKASLVDLVEWSMVLQRTASLCTLTKEPFLSLVILYKFPQTSRNKMNSARASSRKLPWGQGAASLKNPSRVPATVTSG